MMFGIGMGPSGEEKGQYNLLKQQTGFATGLGEQNLTAGSSFFQNLLTNPAKALAPEISAGQTQVQQAANQGAQFGNRGGGTNAATQSAAAANRGNIINLMGRTQTGAASELTSSGQNLLGQGMTGAQAGFSEAQKLHQESLAQLNDLINDIAATVAGGVSGGLAGGGLSGIAGGAMRGAGVSSGVSPSMFSGGSGNFSAGWDQ